MNLKTVEEKYIVCCTKQKALNDKTIKAYKADLDQYIEYSDGSLTKGTLNNYISWLHSKFKPRTVKRKIASLKAFVHYLLIEDVLENNPFDKVVTSFTEPDILPRVMSAHTVCNILKEAHNAVKHADTEFKRRMALRDTAVLEALFATGARVSEICNLTSDNVHLEDHSLKIFGKGSKERILFIENSEVLELLAMYKFQFNESISQAGYFFINKSKSRLSERAVRDIICKYADLAGCEQHITPHMFRHTFATLMLEADVDIRYIQRMLGHSSITTTQIYTHVAAAKQKEILTIKHPRNNMNLR